MPKLPRFFSFQILILVAILVLISVLILFPAGMVIYESFKSKPPGILENLSINNYLKIFSLSWYLEASASSVEVAVGATAIALVFGLTMAWIVSRTDTPFRKALELLIIIPMFLSSFNFAIAWSILGNPTNGLINVLLEPIFHGPIFNIYGLWGIIWVMGLDFAPLMFLICIGTLKTMDVSLEESSTMSGASSLHTALHITLPLIAPSILAGCFLIIVLSLGQFGIPAVIGIPERFYVLSTRIWRMVVAFPPDYGLAAATASPLLAISIIGIYIHKRYTGRRKFTTITGRGYRPRPIKLGKWRFLTFAFCMLFLFLMVFLPLFVLVFCSFSRYWSGTIDFSLLSLNNYNYLFFEYPLTWSSISNGLISAGVAAAIGITIALLISWIIHRTKIRGRWSLDVLSGIPLGIPGIVLALGFLWAFIYLPTGLYGTLWVIILAFVAKELTYGVRTTSGGLLSVDPSLSESASICGSSWWRNLFSIDLPLIKPSIFAGIVILFLRGIREISTPVLLSGPGTQTLSVAVFELWLDGDITATAAFAVVQTVIMLISIMILQFALRIRITEAAT